MRPGIAAQDLGNRKRGGREPRIPVYKALPRSLWAGRRFVRHTIQSAVAGLRCRPGLSLARAGGPCFRFMARPSGPAPPVRNAFRNRETEWRSGRLQPPYTRNGRVALAQAQRKPRAKGRDGAGSVPMRGGLGRIAAASRVGWSIVSRSAPEASPGMPGAFGGIVPPHRRTVGPKRADARHPGIKDDSTVASRFARLEPLRACRGSSDRGSILAIRSQPGRSDRGIRAGSA